MALVEFIEFMERENVDRAVQQGLVVAYGCVRDGLAYEVEDGQGRSLCGDNGINCIYKQLQRKPRGRFSKLRYCAFGSQETHLDRWMVLQDHKQRRFGRIQNE